MTPYWNKNLFEFVILFFQRMGLFFSGQLSFIEFASDELQIFIIGSIGISCALLGVLLVLRKMTMLANSLSHTILIGIILCYLFFHYRFNQPFTLGQLFFASVLTAFITAFATQILRKNLHLQEDASIGLVFTSFFSIGILLVTLITKNAHLGTDIVMGNADVLHVHDLPNALYLLCLNFISVWFFFPQWKAICFDEGFAKSIGMRISAFHYGLMLLTAASSMMAFRVVGVLLVLSFIVAPALIAKLWAKSMKQMIYFSMGISLGATFLGVAISRHIFSVYSYALSTSGIITTLLGVFYLLILLTRSKVIGTLLSSCKRKISQFLEAPDLSEPKL